MKLSKKLVRSESPSALSSVFTVPPFARECFSRSQQEWVRAESHPFVRALIDGSLDPDRFRYYQMQDARYLEAYADTCSLISVRMRSPEDKMWFIEGARLAIVVERQLHEEYGKQLGYDAKQIATMALSPDNRAYQNHLLTVARSGTLLEAIAALTPCAWIYSDLGLQIMNEVGDIPEDHPYCDWLKMYADPSFLHYTNDLLAHLQRQADLEIADMYRSAAIEQFRLSVGYEYLFWDQAWNSQI